MIRIETDFCVSTPLFLAGFDQSAAELRASSIKGVLRFWWRALAWSRLQDCTKVREEESELFGSPNGQSAVVLNLSHQKEVKTVPGGQSRQDWNKPGQIYLGYGVLDRKGNVESGRAAVEPPASFTLRLLLRPGRVSPAQEEQLIEALIFMGLFGGLGSRSRRAFGSLTLTRLSVDGEERYTAPRNMKELQDLLSQKLQRYRTGPAKEPPYTAFSPLTKVVLVPPGEGRKTASSMMNWLGTEFLQFRSWGRKQGQGHETSAGLPAEQNFPIDHDIAYQAWGLGGSRYVSGRHPQRLVFGAPHNYFTRQGERDYKLIVQPEGASERDETRRASPLLFHIHQLEGENGGKSGEGAAVGVVAFIPAQFLPDGRKVWIKQPRGDKGSLVPLDTATLWDPILGQVTDARGNRKPGLLERIRQNSQGVML